MLAMFAHMHLAVAQADRGSLAATHGTAQRVVWEVKDVNPVAWKYAAQLPAPLLEVLKDPGVPDSGVNLEGYNIAGWFSGLVRSRWLPADWARHIVPKSAWATQDPLGSNRSPGRVDAIILRYLLNDKLFHLVDMPRVLLLYTEHPLSEELSGDEGVHERAFSLLRCFSPLPDRLRFAVKEPKTPGDMANVDKFMLFSPVLPKAAYSAGVVLVVRAPDFVIIQFRKHDPDMLKVASPASPPRHFGMQSPEPEIDAATLKELEAAVAGRRSTILALVQILRQVESRLPDARSAIGDSDRREGGSRSIFGRPLMAGYEAIVRTLKEVKRDEPGVADLIEACLGAAPKHPEMHQLTRQI
ncbi:MAG: hypothetical protein FJ279_21200, partial [Planctomycetes bacterium]|nr:hypothetical protein [Planctomycetota bacterium]